MLIKENLRQIIYEAILQELGENNITPTVPVLQQWFHELNQKYFNGILPDIQILVEPIGGRTWGKFRFRRLYDKRRRTWVTPFGRSEYYIIINSNYDGPESVIKGTLLHEMVHYYIFYKLNYRPTRSHGDEFLGVAHRVTEMAKSLGEPYVVTPTSDNDENTVSQTGLEKYKNRITGEYLVGIAEFKTKYGTSEYWMFRTEEKYMQVIMNSYENSAISFQWYKLLTDNPKFPLLTRASRRTIHGYSSDSVDGVIAKYKEKFGDFQLQPLNFPANQEQKISGKSYVLGVLSNFDDTKFWVFKTDRKCESSLINTYRNVYRLEFYEVTDYDFNFDMIPMCRTKVTGKYSGFGRDIDLAEQRFKDRFKCNFTVDV